MIRKFLTLLIVTVLAVVPCAGANASMELNLEGMLTHAVGSSGSDSHFHAGADHGNDHHGDERSDPLDCWLDCDPDTGFMAQSRESLTVAPALANSVPIDFALLHVNLQNRFNAALDHLRPSVPSDMDVREATSILRRTARLRL